MDINEETVNPRIRVKIESTAGMLIADIPATRYVGILKFMVMEMLGIAHLDPTKYRLVYVYEDKKHTIVMKGAKRLQDYGMVDGEYQLILERDEVTAI